MSFFRGFFFRVVFTFEIGGFGFVSFRVLFIGCVVLV